MYFLVKVGEETTTSNAFADMISAMNFLSPVEDFIQQTIYGPNNDIKIQLGEL